MVTAGLMWQPEIRPMRYAMHRRLRPKASDTPQKIELARSTDDEKQSQLTRLEAFHQLHAGSSAQALAALQQAAIDNENVFEKLMEAVRVCSLGQITTALFEVGGQYRRNM